MAKTLSTMQLTLGAFAPPFKLPDVNGQIVGLNHGESTNGILIAFICNHCPFVKHIIDNFVEFTNVYQQKGLAIVGINSNDVEAYPEDHPDEMKKLVSEKKISFPYLFDETQEVAKAYGAACTPDFFLFNGYKKLVYRGQYDSSRPGNNEPVTGKDLGDAIDALLACHDVSPLQKPSIGCNIKWKPGNEPDYYGSTKV